MTSYMSYPSQKVTELLSKYLEFDPSELELGIWSGDIQLKNLTLRQETIHPLLNKKANKPHTDPLKKAPLHLKLVKGTIGQMRLQIPWKRLVWGQGAVKIEVSEVMIVLSFQSREETEEQRKKGLLKTKAKKNDADASTGVSQAYRDAKQRRLREAERRHLQGMPLALYLDALHRKNSIQRDAAKAAQAAKRNDASKPKQPGRIDKWLQNKGSDLFWRFFAGIQGSITKARIVIVQDGVEVGCIVQSIEVIAGRDGTKINVNMEETSEGPSEGAMTAAELTPPQNVMYESGYEDGEHVDKEIKQQGLGLFVRKVVSMANVPQALRFSNSVSADDYILRPVDLDFSFSFFYPYPPERRKKRAIDNQSQETPTTAASSVGASHGDSPTSSKRRRDKRQRDTTNPAPTPDFPAHTPVDERRDSMGGSTASATRGARLTGLNADSRLRTHQRWIAPEVAHKSSISRSQAQRYASMRSSRSGTFHTAQHTGIDHVSVQESATATPGRILVSVPKLDCRASLKEIRVVFTTRHYELLNYFLSTVARMKNGRPDQLIRATPKETEAAALHRKFFEPTSPRSLYSPRNKRAAKRPNATVLSSILAPLTGFRASSPVDAVASQTETTPDPHELMPMRRSVRSKVLVKWWTYSIGAILWEVRKRKHLASNFREMFISFDWDRQRHKRKEYVELYIAKKLDKRPQEGVWPFEEEDTRDEQLLAIEDELPLEQILLYRSIARSARVQGMKTMPDSVLDLHTRQSQNLKKHRKSKLTNPLTAATPDETVPNSSFLAFIQHKFDASSQLRLPGGVRERFNSNSKSKHGIAPRVHGDMDDYYDDEENEVQSSESLRPNMPPPPPARSQRVSSGLDGTIHSESDGRIPTPRQMFSRKAGTPDIQAGSYYASGGNRRDSQADGRTVRTNQKRDSKSARLGPTGSALETAGKADDRMIVSFALQIKSIDMIIVEEEYHFELSPELARHTTASGRISPGAQSREYYSGGEESSSDEVSELSVLTDDQRFFNESGHIGMIAEEEEDEERVRMSSTDFLLFGLPENPLLRLTITSLSCSLKGRSGGPFNTGVTIRQIRAVADNDTQIFSMGASEPITPVAEISVGSGHGRRSFDTIELDLPTNFGAQQEPRILMRDGMLGSGRALSLVWYKEENSNDIQCDLSRIALNLDLGPAKKLLEFYAKSEIKFPSRILEKSSVDVARKFMVYKTVVHKPVGALSVAFRIHGLEIIVPFFVPNCETSEASDVDASNNFETDSHIPSATGRRDYSLFFGMDCLDLYTGTAVDAICAAANNDLGASRSSLFSGSLASRRSSTVKTLEMLDVVALTATNDSFSCRHWIATIGGAKCYVNERRKNSVVNLIDFPIDIEVLSTVNETSLLESDTPRNQVVVEISPVHLLLSERRLDFLQASKAALDFSFLDTSSTQHIKHRKPDPPRIEILSHRILHSVDLNCRRVQLAIVKDVTEQNEESGVSAKLKEVIMEECLADFLSIVSCFDFSLPNEEALSSAMQVCIGRLVGLGMSDDEAWGCTNAARLNFLDDIALMRRAQTDALVQLSTSIRKDSYLFKTPVQEESSGNGDSSSSSAESLDFVEESLAEARNSLSGEQSVSNEFAGDGSDDDEDDDSANSAEIVETTLHNAVEKTVATFAPLLQSYHRDHKDLNLHSVLTLDLPLGFRTSLVKLFYDQHVTCMVTSLVLTNAAGIELLTLVPHSAEEEEEEGSLEEDQEDTPGQGLVFSRFELDKDFGFGRGGLPMSALAEDDCNNGVIVVRERNQRDDFEIGEVEILFSSKIYEGIIDEISKLRRRSEENSENSTSRAKPKDSKNHPKNSLVTIASSMSVLFTSDELVPFCRITLERMCYKTLEALDPTTTLDVPSWTLIADAASLQNLTPEGQFYPEVLTVLSPHTANTEFPLEVRYFKSPDPWQFSSRLDIDFKGFRLFLLRQFLYEILHFFVYDKYGIGRLKKKYSKDVRDMNGNPRPPLLYAVNVYDSSVICPRCSSSSDMVAFEVEEARIAVSYIPRSFKMPTEASEFDPSPTGDTPEFSSFSNGLRRNSVRSSFSEYHDCASEEALSESEEQSTGYVSSFSKELMRRLTITFSNVDIFTVIAKDNSTRDIVESPLFRFFHTLDGRASHGKPVYARKLNIDRLSSLPPESLSEDDRLLQRWEQINTELARLIIFADYVPYMRLFIGSPHHPLSLDARLSQLCLLLSVWDSNMQEMPALFVFKTDQVTSSAKPPVIPEDFPGYGTNEFVAHLEGTPNIRSEICCIFKAVSLRCTFDRPGHFPVDPTCFQYFEDPSCPDNIKPGLILTLEDGVVHVINDFFNIRRIGIGASSLELIDERRESQFQTVLAITREGNNGTSSKPPAWADTKWGLRNDCRTLGSSLPIPVQCTVFMTPGWSMINVGAQNANGVMHELSWIWIFLGYFKSYYTDIAFGNPGHQAQRWTHKLKNAIRRQMGEDPVRFQPLPGINVDFRLWLCKPILCIPSDYNSANAPSLRIESRTGLWYRYKSVQHLSSQEVSTTDLNLFFANEFRAPNFFRRSDTRDGISGGRPLVEGLSFGLRYDSNNLHNHKDVSVLIPFAGEDIPDLSVAGKELEVCPTVLPSPKVCKPMQQISRTMGLQICEITCIIEVLPITIRAMTNFFKGPTDCNPDFIIIEEDQGPPTYSLAAQVEGLRLFVIDPVLGVQLPIAVASLASMQLTFTQFSAFPVELNLESSEAPVEDVQVSLSSSLWADYFKLGLTRSWEPLLEPFEFTLMYEQAKERGHGFSVDAGSPFQITLSGALLQVLGETMESLSTLIKETFGGKSENELKRSVSFSSKPKDQTGAIVEDSVQTIHGNIVEVLHEIPKRLKSEDRVAFSLRNQTGQKIRVHQETDRTTDDALRKPAIVTYLKQSETMGLTFAATISIIKNLSVVEVPYPGFPESARDNKSHGSLIHAVDVQVPGFRWVQGIKVDTFGRKFEALVPRSLEVHAKLAKDWRLKNALMLLTEVGLDNGGRLVTVRTLFEIKNSTTHPIKLVYDPDPTRRPVEARPERHDHDVFRDTDSILEGSVASQYFFATTEEIEVIRPGSTFQIPTLLLERSLQLTGSHLGSLWLCPDTKDKSLSCWDYFKSNGSRDGEELHASFCSRPIQLAKLVHESSLIFQSGSGQDVPSDEATSGIQVSCPTRTRKGAGRAPFCYAIEVGRSPLVNTNKEKSDIESKDGGQIEMRAMKKKTAYDKKSTKFEENMHGPVAYTLSIHAPLVIVNLLPEGGRFELMHAVRKTVVWYADLEPGQQIPVHSVGLDAPLLLLVNLGFCRTPVGEGALVHHGVDTVTGGKEQGVRFMSLGKAALKGTKQIGKTLTAISNSPDRRGQGRLGYVNAPQFYNRQNRKEKARTKVNLAQHGSLGTDADDFEVSGGKVHSVDTVAYSQHDVATETTVVDSIGQRLTLSIENTRGGGGQRRVSLFCPFWILNTTEHALRYKQDKGKAFVSGTVSSVERDGSKPVDGSNRNYLNHHRGQISRRTSSRQVLLVEPQNLWQEPMNSRTIFGGTPGALATSPGHCELERSELEELLNKEIPLKKLAQLAFMFNFHEEGMSIGHQMLSVQLFDGTGQLEYTSEWSRGFSLESVGFSQIISMNTRDGRAIELSAEVNVAPGFLSSYTKIVRFLPRYVVYNRLERPIRLWQDSSVFRPVNEDRAATSDFLVTNKESRKWRYDFEDKHYSKKVNQYESLYGRPSTITDHVPIAEGTTAHKSALYIATIGPSQMVPFILPDTRSERQLRVDLGGAWNVSSSFAADLPGEHTLKVSRATDLRLLNHVSTRAAPKYKIVLPPPQDAGIGDWDGELGVYFETDWGGDKRIIVKGTKRGKFAYNHTDIRVGDELLRVDGVSVLRMTFAETMKLIKERIANIQSVLEQQKIQSAEQSKRQGVLRRLSIGVMRRNSGSRAATDHSTLPPTQLTLTFRTLEERLRKLRVKAGTGKSSKQVLHQVRESMNLTQDHNDRNQELEICDIEMKSIHNTMFVILREQDKENPAFQIQNRSLNHIVFYRQRGCEGHPWNILLPGESLPYSWEEPMRSKKLTVRVAVKSQDVFKVSNNDISSQNDSASEFEAELSENDLATSSDHEKQAARTARLRQALAFQFVDTEERGGFGPSITVRLEEIGYRTFLPLPSNEVGRGSHRRRKFLNCEVDTDGGTRLLIVSDDSGPNDDGNRNVLSKHRETLRKQIAYEEQRLTGLHSLEYLLQKENEGTGKGEGGPQSERVEVIEGDAKRFVEDFSEDSTISGRHQVVVEVLEAVGLNGSEFVGNCNPYCEVFLKGRSKSRQYFFQKRRNMRKTYFIEKSLNPRWTDQTFVFNVPEQAVRVTRGHHLLVKVRNFRLVGQHPVMGQAAVHFGSLRNQKELVGWYPLAGRTGRSDIENAQLSDVSRGSIKLRVQWVYTTAALIDYFLMLSERRLRQLTKSRDGMAEQLAHAINSDKRRRETKENLSAGRIMKLAKVQQKINQKVPNQAVLRRNEQGNENVVGKLNQGLNSSLTVLRDTLKASRDRYLYALYYQTAESKRNRQIKEEGRLSLGNIENSHSESPNVSENIQTASDQRSTASSGSHLDRNEKTLEQFFTQQQATPTSSDQEAFRRNKQTLDDFFAKSKAPGTLSPFQGGQVHNKEGGGSPRRTNRRVIDNENTRRLVSHRRLSLDFDEPVCEEESFEETNPWEPSLRQGQALYDGLYGQVPDLGISDLISVSTDVDEEAKRRRNTRVLMSLGFAFHEHGSYFHEDHLPRHFRRSLFASSMDERKSNRLYRPRFAVGTPTAIRHFKSWQAAGALHWDSELEVLATEDTFLVRFRPKRPELPKRRHPDRSVKQFMYERLRVPEVAPMTTKERSVSRADALYQSRSRFERCARRTLGSALNPGGWLTVRPITALNLPDAYTGMFVKLRYGSEVLVSETVSARVSPRWGSSEMFEGIEERRSASSRKPFSSRQVSDEELRFKFTENDLHVHVEPQQTSGSIKISIMAERLNTKTELGVLDIPLGAAIAACLDEELSGNDSTMLPRLPTYTRWFPLMSPRMAVPVEGDMGLSARPTECEQPRDSMFQQYFTPCIQLALMWWPDSEENIDSDMKNEIDEHSGALTIPGPSAIPRILRPPTVQSYFNADIARVSIALIDSQRAMELLSLAVMDVEIRYSVTKSKTRIGLVVGWIQLDNHDSRSREPVVFAPTPSESMQPTLQILALKDNIRTKSSIVSYEYVGVAFQEMDLTVEESWVFELWEFLMGVMRRRTARKNTLKGQRRTDFLLTTKNCFIASDLEECDSPTLHDILEGTGGGGPQAVKKKIYIEQLILGLVKINLSYVKGKKQSFELSDRGARALKNLEVGELPNLAQSAHELLATQSRSDQSEVFVKWSQHMNEDDLMDNGGYNLPAIIAAVFPSVSDAPIRLQGKIIDHVFETRGEIISSIKNFYVNETLKQVYKIVGSLDFVGNPTILFSSFVSGVRDLVAAPTSAFLKSPTNVNQVGIAVGKGTLSLFSHSASGIFGFAAKMAATAGQAAAILSLDTEFRQWHHDRIVTEVTNLNRVWKRRGVQSVPEMLTRPVGDILLGVAMGTSGLIISPYKGLKNGGGFGFVKGIAVGTAGAVAKPLVGVLDAFTHFSATIHDVAKSVNVLERRLQPALKLRLPYTFGPMNILSPFDHSAARSVLLLSTFPQKSRSHSLREKNVREIHVHTEVLNMEPGIETYAIATTTRVVLIRLRKDTNGSLLPSLGWEVDLSEQNSVTSKILDHGHNGVALTITRRVTEERKGQERDVKGWRAKRLQEATKSSAFSSSRSLNSNFSDLEEEEDYDIDVDILSTDEMPQGDAARVTEEVEHSIDHGATKKGGEVLKWYTVLAEYQHRRQLTAMHNVISCIVGDFDSVIADHSHDIENGNEFITSFGMFTFGHNTRDGKSAHASNKELVASLENLPWMHEEMFTRVQAYPPREQKEFVSNLRQNWVFLTDLEASRAEGGPHWLIEARARAMFVSAEAPNVPDILDSDDPVVREVLVELEQGNISSERASELLYVQQTEYYANGDDEESHASLTGQSERNLSVSRELLYPKSTEQRLARVVVSAESGVALEKSVGQPTVHREESVDKEGEIFVSAAENASSSPSTVNDIDAPMTIGKNIETQPGSIKENPRVSSSRTPPAVGNKGKESRIDRMETLMEQLVILNAQQVQKHQVAPDDHSDNESGTGMRVADVLKHDLEALRAQVQARAAEDDALRNEIALLRQQLADRRQQPKENPSEKMRRMPDILRFGSATRKHERESNPSVDQQVNGPNRQIENKEPSGEIGSIYNAPLNESSLQAEDTNLTKGHIKKIRRKSGESHEDTVKRASRRTSGESMGPKVSSPTTSSRRLSSGERAVPSKPLRRSSGGSEFRRRASGQ